ncbi:uncharacterized protein I303_101697 [Kwoniella dejecticola CBS 10117]|uniref:Uncharacterized protein n=1 Tax=Kwoniella dejecticola CBS 10117 TaxID=1296121 RepID=A0A1A6AD18_9TREE|nr:uncharacterized protein I303_02167 [Kwoniella dejecticola CBS 10117]OBR87951.1 hypothetical protein I303_02167 [Kwoniella dejecticola CBS 10117]
MPFFQSLQEFKGLTSSINPLNLFSSEPPATASTSATPTPNGTPKPASAVAGPGPSTQAMRQPSTPSNGPAPLGRPINPRQPSSGPIRPSLKHADTSSSSPNSSDSSDSNTRRRTSGTNVMIADPEVSGIQGQGERRRSPRKRSGSRPPSSSSGATGISGIEGEQRSKKKKSPLDTYIIVKPPPTSAKNPLNLQIQLVVKPNRPRRDRSASGISSRSGSIAGEGLIASPSSSPAAQTVELPTEESDDTSATEVVVSPEAATTIPSPGNDKALPGSPKSSSTESEGANGASLRRSSSIRSSISTSTAATGSSAASGKRIEPMFNLAVHNVMQPTVVTDAATDVKVAKFYKRNLDITGVGVLEPSEVWLPTPHTSALFASASRHSADGEGTPRQRPLSIVSLTSPISPTLSRSDDGKSGIRGSLDLKVFKMENLRLGQNKADGESKTRQFFGKVFKKKTSMGDIGLAPKKTSPSASFSSHDHPPKSATSASHDFSGGTDTLHPNSAVIARGQAANTTDLPSVGVGAPTFGTAPLVVRRRSSGAMITPEGAVTGLTSHSHVDVDTEQTATRMERCQSLPILPSNRPVGYTWTVRKWAKKNEEGWAAHIKAAASAGLEIVGANTGAEDEDQVVFEWVKLRVPSNSAGDDILRRYSTTGAISLDKSRARSQTRASSVPPTVTDGININSPNTSRTSLSLQPPSSRREASPFPPSPNLHSNQSSPLASPRLDGRPEPVRRISGTASGPGSASNSRRSSTIIEPASSSLSPDNSSIHGQGGDTTADETATVAGDDSDPEDSETPWTCSVWVKKTGQRQLLGTLTPAPHHPKVIGILKIPQGLQPICLTDFKQPENGSGAGVNVKEGTIKKLKENVALSEENLKDVVCVTAMWLVAREEFNGLGKKKGGGRRGTQV